MRWKKRKRQKKVFDDEDGFLCHSELFADSLLTQTWSGGALRVCVKMKEKCESVRLLLK